QPSQRRQTIDCSTVATSFPPQSFTKAATPPIISFGDVEDAQAFGLNEWIRGLRLDADHASPSIARPTTKLGRTRQPDPCVHLRLRGRPARRESTPDAIEDHGCAPNVLTKGDAHVYVPVYVCMLADGVAGRRCCPPESLPL